MQGRRLVLVLYALIVSAAAVAGVLVAVFIEQATSPRLFFLVPLPPTMLGFAVYGAVTVGTILGVGLLLVALVSRRVETVDAAEAGHE